MKEGAYNFKAALGADNSRFSLKFQKNLKLTDSEMNDNSINAYAKNGTLYVKSGGSAFHTVRVFDLQGRLIAEQKNIKLNAVTISYLNSNQTLIVQVNTEDNKITNKKVIVPSFD